MSNVAGYFRGKPACSCLLKWLPAYEAELLRRGLLKSNLDVWQLIGGAAASGGTHALGGCFDIAQTSREQIAIARQMGADATWFRRYNWDGKGGMAHTHGVLRGCPHNGPARYQIAAVDQGYNGLGWMGRGGKDDGPRPLTRRTWQQGIAWAKSQTPKPVAHRIGTWNVALIIKRPDLADRVKRIRAKVKLVRLDVLGVQEAPSSGDGRHLKATLIGRDGKRMKRVGAKARYIFLRSDAKVHGSATWNPWPKNKKVTKPVTTACATIDGHKRFYVNCHPVSGAGFSKHRELHAKATIVKSIRRAKKHGLGREDVVFMGDFNGPEFATVAARYGFVRVRKHAKTVGSIVRTYQAFGKKKRTDAGGQYDYILVHESKAKSVTRARTFWTWKASDHNLTIAEIKEV